MSPQQYQKFKQSLKETQEKSARMLQRMDKTLSGVRQTIKQIQENETNYQNFKKAFGDVMTKLAEKIAGSFIANPFKKIEGKTYEHLPQELPVSTIVKTMLKYKEILIITGAGVSAPSGIPTFRGINGLYDKKFQWQNKKYEPEEFITKAFYDQHPRAIWEWIEEIYKMANQCKPNKIHELIDVFAKALNARGKKVTIVTQNIDDFHYKPKKQQYQYYAVHGNVKQVRCDNMHLYPYTDFRKTLIQQDQAAKCPTCGHLLRPHVLFFDQSYGPLYGETVKDKQFPFVFVIGSSLSTGLCTKLTLKGEQVVQINPNPVIEIGRVYRFSKDTAQTLSQFLKSIRECK